MRDKNLSPNEVLLQEIVRVRDNIKETSESLTVLAADMRPVSTKLAEHAVLMALLASQVKELIEHNDEHCKLLHRGESKDDRGLVSRTDDNERSIKEITKRLDKASERLFQVQLMLLATFLTGIIGFIIVLWQQAH